MDDVIISNSLKQNYHSMIAKKIAIFPNFLVLILLSFDRNDKKEYEQNDTYNYE